MPAVAEDLDVVTKLLTRLGIEEERAKKLNPDRARERLIKRLSSQGVPESLSKKEKDLVEGLGFSTNGQAKKVEAKTEAKTDAKAEAKAEAKNGGKAEEQTIVHVLLGKDGVAKRKEQLAPSVADAKTLVRKDGAKWVPESKYKGPQLPDEDKSIKTAVRKHSREEGPIAAVKKLFATRKRVERDEFLQAVEDAGGTRLTALTYYNWMPKAPEAFGGIKVQKEGRGGPLVKVG